MRALRGILATCGFVILEAIVCLFWSRRELSTFWELQHGIANLAPLALPFAAAAGLLGSFLLGWLENSDRQPWSRWLLSFIGLLGGGATAWAVGGGRHLANLSQRLGLVTLVGVGLAWIIGWASPRCARFIRSRRAIAGCLAVIGLLGLELANRFVLVRLYPGFHTALAMVTPVLAPSLDWIVPAGTERVSRDAIAKRKLVSVAGLVAAAAITTTLLFLVPRAAQNLARFDNFRLILLNNAPLLSQAVRLAARLTPPAPLANCDNGNWDESCNALEPRSSESDAGFSLRGRDVLLITVDALRADHLGVYGYGRNTSRISTGLPTKPCASITPTRQPRTPRIL